MALSEGALIPVDVRVAAARQLVGQLRAYRRSLGMTQTEVARLIGVNQSSLSDVERGTSNPSTLFLVSYAFAVGVLLVPRPFDEVV